MKPLSFLLVLALLFLLPYPAQADDGRTVTMKMTDVDVIDAIQAIAEVGGANVIVSPKVKGKITISFADTPWKNALESVAQALGFKLVKEKFGIYTIVPAKEAPAPAEGGWSARKVAAEKQTADLKVRLQDVSVRLDEAKQGGDMSTVKRLTRQIEEVTRRIAALRRKGGDMRDQPTAAEAAPAIRPREIAVENPQMANALLELDLLEAEEEYQATKFGEKNEGLQQLRRQIKIRKLALERMAKAFNRARVTKRAEAEDARKKVERMLAESAKRARALEAALAADKVQSFEEDEARTLQLFDVSDLQKAGHKVEGVAKKAVGHDGTVTLKGGQLVVHSKPAGIERLVAKLTELRAGSPFASRLLKGRVAAEQPPVAPKSAKGPKTFRLGSDGRFAPGDQNPRVILVDGTWVSTSGRTIEDDHEREIKQRVDQLRQAAQLLAAAGDAQGSQRTLVRARQLQKELEDWRRQLRAAARTDYKPAILTRSAGDLRTLQAITSLRKDVVALRSEVRELTALVRQLLHDRR